MPLQKKSPREEFDKGSVSMEDADTGKSETKHFDCPEQEAYLNLWRTYDCLKSLEDSLFGEFDLSAQQYNALRLLKAQHPDSMPTLVLGRRLISRCPDTTRMLDRLEARGLVVRNRPPHNRRMVEITITPDGLELLQKMRERVLEMHSKQLGHLDAVQLGQLSHFLKLARKPHEDATCDWLDHEG